MSRVFNTLSCVACPTFCVNSLVPLSGDAFWTLRDLQTHPSAAMQCSQHWTELPSLILQFRKLHCFALGCIQLLEYAIRTVLLFIKKPNRTTPAIVVQRDGKYIVNIFLKGRGKALFRHCLLLSENIYIVW